MTTEQKTQALAKREPVKESDESTAIFQEMDRRDEVQIISELSGAYIEEMVYEVQGRVALSWAGIKECVRRMGSIKLEEPKVQDTGDSYIVMVKAIDTINKIEMWGGAQQKKMMRLKDGKEVEDPHSFVKALSKSQRNACRAVVPEIMLQKLMQSHYDQKRALPAAPARAAAPPPAAARESSQRVAALDVIEQFKNKGEGNRKILWTMLGMKGYNIQNFPGWPEVPDEVLAYLLQEIVAHEKAVATPAKDEFTPAGKLI